MGKRGVVQRACYGYERDRQCDGVARKRATVVNQIVPVDVKFLFISFCGDGGDDDNGGGGSSDTLITNYV